MKINKLNFFRAQLGEGLFIDKITRTFYFVDILDNKIISFGLLNNEFSVHEFTYIPSNIFGKIKNKLIVLNDFGITSINLKNNKLDNIYDLSNQILSNGFRSNDGYMINDDEFLFGIMDNNNDAKKIGKIFYLKNHELNFIDDCFIPNTFIPFKNGFLISDSKTGEIFYYYGAKFSQKKIWTKLIKSNGSPDGGCMGPDGYIYICIWGASCINKYDFSGNLIDVILLPCKYPTNCKFIDNSLVVTSAFLNDSHTNSCGYVHIIDRIF